MFFGLPYSQALCCAFCLTPAPDFRGSYWGVVGKVFTRMAEYIKHPDMLQPPVEPYYPYPHLRPHPTLQATLPNLTDADDVVRECFGAACAMMADGSASSSGGGSEYCWLWLHYVPVGETDLDNAVAAFGHVKVSDYTEGRYTAAVGTPTVWLVNDENGDPRVWDDPEYLDYWAPDRKAFVGPGYVGWFDKRISAGTENRITYHTVNQATPTVLEWPNTAYTISAGNYHNICEVSRRRFPLALGCFSKEILFPDTTRQKIERYWEIGDFNLANGRLRKPVTIDDDLWDLTSPPFPITISGCTVNGSNYPGRFDETAPTISLTQCSVVLIDWVVSGAQTIEADESTTFSLWDSAIINGADPDTYDTDAEGLSPWQQMYFGFGVATTLRDITGPVTRGTDELPLDGGDAEWGYLRLFEFYASHNQNSGIFFSPSFGCHYRPAMEGRDEIGYREANQNDSYTDPDTSVVTIFPAEQEGIAIPDPGVDDFTGSTGGGDYHTIYVGQTAPNDANFSCVRVPRKLGGQSDADPRYYLVGNLGSAGFTWPSKDLDSEGAERVVWPFYDSSGSGSGGTLVSAPQGFWQEPGGAINKGNFAIQGQWDTAHPWYETVANPEDGNYSDDGTDP